jgi:hypothetical protein
MGMEEPQTLFAWQPIETAPKDQDILVSDGDQIWLATWGEDYGWYAKETDAPSLSADYLSSITDWMPLPELPKRMK